MKAYSVDLRQKIITVHAAEDISQRQLSERFQVSLSTIQRYLKRVRNGDGLEPKAHGGGNPPKLTPAQLDRVGSLIQSNNDATLAEYCDLIAEREKVKVSRSTMGRIAQSLGLARKKNAARQ